MKSFLSYFEALPLMLPTADVSNESIRRQVQVTVEHEDIVARASLHRGKFEFVEAFWIWRPSEVLDEFA